MRKVKIRVLLEYCKRTSLFSVLFLVANAVLKPRNWLTFFRNPTTESIENVNRIDFSLPIESERTSIRKVSVDCIVSIFDLLPKSEGCRGLTVELLHCKAAFNVLTKSDVHIGLLTLTQISNEFGHPETELGYRIHYLHQGMGYASESAGALVSHLLQETDIQRIVSYIEPNNTASIKVANSIAMKFDRVRIYNSVHVNVYAIDREARTELQCPAQ